jgi:hypothetical protein
MDGKQDYKLCITSGRTYSYKVVSGREYKRGTKTKN